MGTWNKRLRKVSGTFFVSTMRWASFSVVATQAVGNSFTARATLAMSPFVYLWWSGNEKRLTSLYLSER